MKTRLKTIIINFILLLSFFATTGHALTFSLPHDGDLIGELKAGVVEHGETIAELARRYQLGYYELLRANPHINPKNRLQGGTQIIVPTRYVLPPGERKGIVINLPELRLYYYPEDRNVVITEPVGIGREGSWKTPIGETKITAKVKDPSWRPTRNVRAEAARNGTPIPAVFPPGPNNPLGRHSMRLGWPTYLIHSTNRPDGVGARVSAGCIRMFPEAIEHVFDMIGVGTPVRIINEPYKVGWADEKLYFEAHEPLSEAQGDYKEGFAPVVAKITAKKQGREAVVRWSTVKNLIERPNGVPYAINH